MGDRPQTNYWINKFQKDSLHGHKRFKRLPTGYPKFEMNEDLIDTFDYDKFIEIEEHRIPIFIGSQFGTEPDINEMPDLFNGRKLIAILHKSLHSRHVDGLYLCQIKEGESTYSTAEVKFFKND